MARIPKEARRWLAAIGRQGGQSQTAKKQEAARRNGRKGGRPRKEQGL